MKEYSDKDVEKYVRAAEEHMERMSDLSHMTRRPFDTVFTSPGNLFRLGVLFDMAQIGLHRVLDFGAGVCWLSSILNKMGAATISIDVSHRALKTGQALFESDPSHKMELEPLFVSYDGKSFPLEDECVDRVLSFDAFHHVPNPGLVMGEIYRVLKPGGIFAMIEPGTGHSTSAEAARERDQFGTLEQDVDMEEVAKIASRARFDSIRVSMHTMPGAQTVSMDEYRRFMGGKNKAFPFDTVRGHLKHHTAMAMHKGPAVIDSRRPGTLSAELKIIDEPGEAKANDRIKYRVVLKNTGDTIWLKEAPYGGYVRLGAHLLDGKGNVAQYEYGRGSLTEDVKPGQKTEVSITLTAPARGSWAVEFDPVDEGVSWFSDMNGDTRKCTIELNVL